LQSFTEGRLLDETSGPFWADPKFKPEILDKLRRLLAGKAAGDLIRPELAGMAGTPRVEWKGDQARIGYPLRIHIRDAPRAPARFIVEARLVIEGPFTGTPRLPNEYRVSSIELLRGGTGAIDLPRPPKK
jgi:hypothetical protein